MAGAADEEEKKEREGEIDSWKAGCETPCNFGPEINEARTQ